VAAVGLEWNEVELGFGDVGLVGLLYRLRMSYKMAKKKLPKGL
jgi:hypothetical protein